MNQRFSKGVYLVLVLLAVRLLSGCGGDTAAAADGGEDEVKGNVPVTFIPCSEITFQADGSYEITYVQDPDSVPQGNGNEIGGNLMDEDPEYYQARNEAMHNAFAQLPVYRYEEYYIAHEGAVAQYDQDGGLIRVRGDCEYYSTLDQYMVDGSLPSGTYVGTYGSFSHISSDAEEELFGFHSWDGSVTEASIYSGREEAPVYYLDENHFFPVHPDTGSNYSPFSGGGIYYNTIIYALDKPDSTFKFQTFACDPQLFAAAGVDISGYHVCKEFASDSRYTLYQMDDEIWLMERWKDDEIVITRLKKEDHYDFVPAVRENEAVWLLRDLSAPQVPDIADPNTGKEELLRFIGQTDDSRIVAHLENACVADWYSRYYGTGSAMAQRDGTFWYDEYRVMEYRDGELCSWLSYVFWDTKEHYAEAKENEEWNPLRLQNDFLLMTCEIYAYDEALEPGYRKDLKAMQYDEMLSALKENGYQIIF